MAPIPMPRAKVIDVIKNYVVTCGGYVPTEYLLQDFEEAYHTKLPFKQFGYASIEDFLMTIDGLLVSEDDDGTFVENDVHQSDRVRQRNNFQADEVDELSVQMTNNLQLDCGGSRRVVKLQSSDANTNSKKVTNGTTVMKQGEKAEGNSFLNGGSAKSLFSSPTHFKNIPTGQHSENNDVPTSCSDNSTESEIPGHFTHASYPDVMNFHSQFQTDHENPCENLYPPDTYNCVIPESSRNIQRSTSTPFAVDPSMQLEELHRSIYTPDLYASNFSTPVTNGSGLSGILNSSIYSSTTDQFASHEQYVPKPESACIPSMCQPISPLGVITPFQTTLQDVLLRNDVSDFIPQFSTASPNSTDDEITDRIVRLVNSQKQIGGIDSSTIELKFKEKHRIPLPPGWISILEERGALYVEQLSSCTIVYPNRYFPIPPKVSSLPALRYPNIDDIWNVHVSRFENVTRILFRLRDEDYDQKYEILRRKMKKHYLYTLHSINHIVRIEAGQLCAVNNENDWFRGEVVASDMETGSVMCFLLDEGIVENFRFEKVYPLHEKFTNTPVLILEGELDSLEAWKNSGYINGKVGQYLTDEPNVRMKVHKFLSERKVSVHIYLQNMMDLNSKVTEMAKTELSLPVLYSGQTYDIVIVSHDEYSARVQIVSPSLKMLQETLQMVTNSMKDGANFERAKVKTMLDLKKNRIYLARCEDGSWKRIICERFHLRNKVSALFVDSGEEKQIYSHDIFETTLAPDILRLIEGQGVLVKISEVDAVTLNCLHLVQSYQIANKFSFAMKILQNDNIPFVQLLWKVSESAELVPITRIFSGC